MTSNRSGSTPRFLQPEVRRRQIVDAAGVVFARQGFSSSRIADIAAEAGVAQGTIYRFFESKEELAMALFDEAGKVSARKVAMLRADPDLSPTEVLRQYIAWNARFMTRYRDLVAAMFSWAIDPGVLRENGHRILGSDELVAQLSEVFADADGVGNLDADLGRLLSLVIYTLGALSRVFLAGDDSEAKMISTLTTIAERVIGLPPADS
jgi:AcrR family transcriptional regulator